MSEVSQRLGGGERVRATRVREEAACQVVEQVRTDAAELVDDLDARALERLPRADARELEEVRSPDRAARRG